MEFVKSDDEVTATTAIRLIGLWKMEELSEQLLGLVQQGEKPVKKAALVALSAMGSEKSKKMLLDLTGSKNSPELRVMSATQLVGLDASEAAKIGTDLMRTVPVETDVTDLFKAFFATKTATEALSEAINTRKIPENFAKAGRQLMGRNIPWTRRRADDVVQLEKVLEASGGTLPVEKMPQQLNDREITALAKTVAETADPALGEKVFRKSELLCQTCHAIGGAGGRIGPDLSSLGTSSPVETIIRSVLYPTLSIKEGYELQRIVKKDGSEMMAYLVSNGTSEVVVRDVAGQEISLAKNQISTIEKTAGSLMPAGLTAGLDKKEFVDLIGFLSKMGGQYRVPTSRFVRRWNTVMGSKELTRKIADEGGLFVAKDKGKVINMPIYSRVSGSLPLDELPVVEGGAGKRFSFVRFNMEVINKGNIELALNSIAGITAWVDAKPIKITSSGISGELAKGIHSFTIAIDRNAFKENSVSVQVLDDQNGSAQLRLMMDM